MTFAAVFAAAWLFTGFQGVNVHPTNSCDPAPGGLVRIDVHLDWYPQDQAGYLTQLDACMAAIRIAGARPIVTVLGDSDPARYAARIGDLAARWPGTIWEVGNEPNISRFWLGTPAAYVRLLRAATTAVRQNDPTALVITGGLAWTNPNGWLTRMYQAGLAKIRVDGVAVHPYWSLAEWRTRLTAFRKVMLRHGDHSPVWITEYGWFGATQALAFQAAASVLAPLTFVRAAVWYDLDRLGA